MKLRHFNGTEVEVTGDKAARLIASGSWLQVDLGRKAEEVPEFFVEAPEDSDGYEDTREDSKAVSDTSEGQEEPSKPAGIPEMRAWALENDIEGVGAKGKLPKHAIDAYKAAHEE